MGNRLDAGAAVRLKGRVVASKGSGQSRELLVDSTEILGACDPEVSLWKRGSECMGSLTIDISNSEETPPTTRSEGYSSFEIQNNPYCVHDENQRWNDARLARLVRGKSRFILIEC